MKRDRSFPFLFFLCWFPLLLGAQHPAWRNYTINDGMPSNGVYALMQDSRGFIWVGTSHGICKFNGYEFVRPIDTSGTQYSSALEILEDQRGRIWFNRLNGRLWIIENDTVRPWVFNHLLDSLSTKTPYSFRFAVGKDGTVWFGTWGEGYIAVSPDGQLKKVTLISQKALFLTNVNGTILTARSDHGPDDEAFRRKNGQTSAAFFIENGQMHPLGRFPVDYSNPSPSVFWMWPLQDELFAGLLHNTYYLFRGNKPIWHGQNDAFAKAIIMLPDGAVLAAMSGGEIQGLFRYPTLEDFKNNRFNNLLPDKSVVRILLDKEGGWWAGSNKSGLFYCKNPQLEVFDRSTGLPADEVMALATNGRDRVYAGMRQFDIAMLERREKTMALLPRAPLLEMTLLRYDTLTGRLWAANNLVYFDQKSWKNTGLTAELSRYTISAKKITPDISGKRWWVSSGQGVYNVNPASELGDIVAIDTFQYLRNFSVSQDKDGILWVTTKDGLKYWRDGKILPPLFQHPALRNNPLAVEQLPEIVGGGQVISLISGGILIRDKTGQCTHLTSKEGLSTDMILGLYVRSDGVVYGVSNAGLNILTRQSPGKWGIETITLKHGLPSNQVNDIVFLGDETWIATDGGVVLFRGKPAPAPMPAPMLEKFVVNNRQFPYQQDVRLKHDQNNLSLRFFALHFRSGGNIPYRYRLSGTDTAFTYSFNREVNFANLSAGKYRFEVQAQNEDGRWSEISIWRFQILPPWYASGWFRSLFVLGLGAAVYLYYRQRIQAVQRAARERERIREMEAAALRAQMNPHFIFNCLQAIQAFVAKNEREAASIYLARFAKLVRLSLHSSVDGRHTLRDEMAMLENYLHLEQLRFGQAFDFEIKVAPNLELDDIGLPPLLIQPFVENAVIHGLKGRKSDGKVKVAFSAEGETLEIEITDNGEGFESEFVESARLVGHKSVGMLLTQKRLDLLNSKKNPVVYLPVRDANGNICGTTVKISIPI